MERIKVIYILNHSFRSSPQFYIYQYVINKIPYAESEYDVIYGDQYENVEY